MKIDILKQHLAAGHYGGGGEVVLRLGYTERTMGLGPTRLLTLIPAEGKAPIQLDEILDRYDSHATDPANKVYYESWVRKFLGAYGLVKRTAEGLVRTEAAEQTDFTVRALPLEKRTVELRYYPN